ncbi:MAG: protein-L-isoaspartate O-methyltransferase, partial [Chloroflexota bacterium]|nr:protein-L-isoaspartate O-methyltransferase [Chloroflexota bacterium]
VGDGTLGLAEHAPYDAIIVTAAAPKVPRPLLDQLDEGGRMVLPVGKRFSQYLECWKHRRGQFQNEAIIPVAFVPLVGERGWKERQ